MVDIINIVGFIVCGLAIYSCIEPKIFNGNKRVSSTEYEKKLKAIKELKFAIDEHIKAKSKS